MAILIMGKYANIKIEYYIISQTSGLVNRFGEFFCNFSVIAKTYEQIIRANSKLSSAFY